ncbi:MAG TPA: Slp family lipoprotein, partial [Nitrospiria bacterium]
MQFQESRRAGIRHKRVVLLLITLCLAGCAYSLKIPPHLADQLDPTIEFRQIQADPSGYAGKLVALGGQILILEEQEEGTLMELLQLPINSSGVPETDAALSQGRFMLMEAHRLDPVIYQRGRMITVVGEVTGKKIEPIDRSTQGAYPFLSARFIHLWPRVQYYPNNTRYNCS